MAVVDEGVQDCSLQARDVPGSESVTDAVAEGAAADEGGMEGAGGGDDGLGGVVGGVFDNVGEGFSVVFVVIVLL